MKRVLTLSNTTQSSGNGIPEVVRAENLKDDFIQTFFDSVETLAAIKQVNHHELSDIYSTIVS